MDIELGDTLIVDAGSTKTDWIVINKNGHILQRCKTDGINPATMDDDAIVSIIRNATSTLPSLKPDGMIFYYGAGCGSTEICKKTILNIKNFFEIDNIFVESDMLGTARGLFGHNRGIACILGTGSNSCLYDGFKITKQIPSLGFILGDEGSGVALGKKLINNIFKNILPSELKEKFVETYKLNLQDIISRTYNCKKPNVFLAEFSFFVKQHIHHPAIKKLVVDEFKTFIEKNIIPYQTCDSVPVRFSGSIACSFSGQLKEAMESFSLVIDEIIPSPIERLISYHSNSNFK